MAPQLRVLHLSQDVVRSGLYCSLVATLSSLEELVWRHGVEMRIDDILYVLKSCRKLTTLTLGYTTIVEELQDVNSTVEPEENPVDVINVDESGWESMSLRSLGCDNVPLGHPNSSHDGQMHVHPCIRLLFQHTPNLTSIEFSERSNLCAADSMKALDALERSCHMLKVLNVGNIRPATDEAFEKVIKVNHQLEKVDAKYTEFGELALKELTRLPATPALPHSLVELDLEGCIQVKSSGIAMALENCERLRLLNLSGTDVGTIYLFKGNKP
ncbi:hypothetical protein BGX26_008284 [Mortierella sp. AD094]|nr:hypothetical protein BGX26_008284 [Mortierella sp. AD094]